MRILRNGKASTVALVLMLTIAATLVALPVATAQPPVRTKKTYAFIGAVPNPVGVGQEVLLHVGITDYLVVVTDGWEDLTVTVTRPDNTTETLGPFRTDATGGTGTTYVPGQVGTYYLQTHFPEQEYTWISPPSFDPELTGTILYEASDSEKLALVVQEESIPYYPGSPLPTEYWTRPIDAQHREWSAISGSWLGYHRYSGPFVPYNDDAPESAHILWAKPLTIGGLAGGELGDHAMECGDAYEGKWSGSIILAGRLYYQAGPYDRPRLYHCVDLHTGEVLWSKTFLDNRSIAFGQLFYWDSYNYHGVFPYLWVTVGGDWHAFDPYTGDWRFTIENVPSGTTMRGPKGEIYRLGVNLAEGWLALWNMSALISMGGSWGSAAHLGTFDAAAIDPATGELTTAAERAWSWNVTIPTGLPGGLRLEQGSKWAGSPPSGVPIGDRVIGGSVTTEEVRIWALGLKSGQEGSLMFSRIWDAPAEWAEGIVDAHWVHSSLEDKVGVLFVKETLQYYGFSLETGQYLWQTEPEHYMNLYASSRCAIAYGRLFTVGYSGIVNCYNITTGKLLWTYEAADPYNEILWSNNWPLYTGFITDGKIYLHHTEHSVIDPKPRGAPFICLDVENGELVFEANIRGHHWGESPIIGDSIMAMYDTYDQRIYAVGKGPSATTVSIQNDVIAHGNSVLIKGTVTDVSPGTKDYALTARFPNGVPAIADEDMNEWMKYVYMQFEVPMDVTGVLVTLDAVDPNGNFINIGTTTSDMSGTFSYMWTPEHEGKYTIIATFPGSKSYYASYAQTGLGVGPAPEESATPEGVQEDIDQAVDSLTPMFLGLIVAVVVIAILVVYNIWCVRKQRK